MTHQAPGTQLALLVARILLVILFLYSGFGKLMAFSDTAEQFATNGIPLPTLATAIAVIVELPLALLVLVGAFTRPLAILLAIFTLGTALVGHPYWAVPDDQYQEMLMHFYKNLAIAGGFLALYAAGAGRISVDALRRKK